MFTADWYKDLTWLCICLTDKGSAVKTFWPLFTVLLRLLHVRLKQDTFFYVVATSRTLCKLQWLCSVCINFICQFFCGGNLFLFFPFELKNIFSTDFIVGANVVLINKSVLLFSQWQLAHIIFILRPAVCSCAELKHSSCFRSWKKHFRRRARFQNMEKRAVIKFISCEARWQKIVCHRQNVGGPF